MKLYKIEQPWQNEPLIENKTEFIDNNQARFACQERKISNPKPRKARRLSNERLTFPSGNRFPLLLLSKGLYDRSPYYQSRQP
jgi:hypothetical protein